MESSTRVTVDLAQSIIRERDTLRRTMETIARRVTEDLGDLPSTKQIPHNFAAGALLAIQGLAQSALEVAP
jgi:hypothetical protein